MELSIDGVRQQVFDAEAGAAKRPGRSDGPQYSPEQAADSHLNVRAPVKGRAARRPGRVHQAPVGADRNRAPALSSPASTAIARRERSRRSTACRWPARSTRRASATRRAGSASLPAIRRSHPTKSSCARTILTTLARRAYRRPVASDEVQTLLGFYKQGRARRQLRARHRDGAARDADQPGVPVPHRARSADARPARAYRIGDLELASRLSFFLWSSIPDEELLDAAVQGPAERARSARAAGAADARGPRAPRRW